MEEMMKVSRIWGAPAVAVVFIVLRWVGEAGRMGPWPGFPIWSGKLPLLFIATAIAVATWKPYVSLSLVAAKGLGNSEIAGSLFVSEATVKTHLRSVPDKVGLRTRLQLLAFVHERRLLG